MRNLEQDQSWIKQVINRTRTDEVVYITPNHYDGGYEVRVGTSDVFVDYPTIDSQDTNWVRFIEN
jgi:hypothetical protein